MKNVLEFELDGQLICIQGAEEAESRSRSSRGESNETTVPRELNSIFAQIAPVGNALLKSLKDINTPDEINLEFGVSLGGKTGIIFASAETEATFKVSITWKNDKTPA